MATKFIFINLNQRANRAQMNAQVEERNKWIIFGSICFLFFSILIANIVITNKINSLANKRIETIKMIKHKTNVLKKDAEINLSKRDIELLYEIESQRILWSKKLFELSSIVPNRMAITNLELANRRLVISAIAAIKENQKDFALVEEFIKVLERSNEFSNDFESIKFKTSERRNYRGQEHLYFVVDAKIKRNIPDKLKNFNLLPTIEITAEQ